MVQGTISSLYLSIFLYGSGHHILTLSIFLYGRESNISSLYPYFSMVQGTMKSQLVGPLEFRGMNLTEPEFEFLLGRTGAIQTSVKEDPKPKVRDVLMSSLRQGRGDTDDLSDEGDW